MKVNIKDVWFQVVEITLARKLLFLAGMGARREDGDNLIVYPERGIRGAFYVSKDTEQEKARTLAVDEGLYSNCLHHSDEMQFTTATYMSAGWCEYVDATELMGVLFQKLCPGVKLKSSEAIGRGRRQQDAMGQFKEHLLKWSQANPDHELKFC